MPTDVPPLRICGCDECVRWPPPDTPEPESPYGQPIGWRGEWWRPDSHGYYIGRGGRRLHREVYEAHYGPIPKGRHVHHRNLSRGDNRPSNLVVVTPKEHFKAHRRAGSIRQRGQTWQVTVELAPDPLTGARRRKTGTAHSAREAERMRARFVAQAADGTAQAPERRTVAELAHAWLAHIEPSRSPYTMTGYRAKVRSYIVPNIGKVRLDKLSTIALDGLYTKLLGQGLSAQTVRHVHAVLHAMLAQARRWRWIVTNPADDASPPSVERVEDPPPSPEQVRALYDAAWSAGDRSLALAIWLCAVTGIRRGEACALKLSDVDGARLTVRTSLVVVGKGELRAKPTKTNKVRVVGLDDHTVRLLDEHRTMIDSRADVCGLEADDGFLLSEHPGLVDPLHPDVLTRRFQRLADRLGIDCHLHLLRHASVSWALAAGHPVLDVSRRVGHATATMTLNRYGHVLEGSPAAAETIAGLLTG